MSLISSQVGELRFMAHMLDTDGHPSFAREVRRAADTIWELRNKLAGTVDQSERIAELETENENLLRTVDSVMPSLIEDNARLKAENAKLLGLVYDMWNDMNVYYVQHERPDSSDMDFYRDRMRELKIEVDNDD